MATKIKSVEHLKEILSDGDGRDFFIQLNFGARSSKFISWDSGENIFYVLNYIDDSEQELTEEMLMDRDYTNIGYAIQMGAFYLDD